MKKVFFLICILLFSATVSFARQAIAQTERRVEVTNQTKSLQVEGTRIFNGILFISLKNIGNKPIISYEMIHEDTDWRMIVQPRPHGNMLKPGDSDSFKGTMGYSSKQEDVNLIKMRLASLYFSDETSEGDPESVDRLKQYHRGSKLAMRKLLPYIEKLIEDFETKKPINLKPWEYYPQFLAPYDFTKPETHGFDSVITNTFAVINVSIQIGNQQQIGKILKDFKQSFEKYRGEKLVSSPKYLTCKERRLLECAEQDERCKELKYTPCDEQRDPEEEAKKHLFFEKVKEYHETGKTSLTEEEIEQTLRKYGYTHDRGKFESYRICTPPYNDECRAKAEWTIYLDFRVKKDEVEGFVHSIIDTYGGEHMQVRDSDKLKDNINNQPAMSWFGIKIDEEGAKRISEHPKVRYVSRVR